MDLAGFKRFVADNNGEYYFSGMSMMFDDVEIYGGRRAIAFSSPISTVILYGIIHIDVIKKRDSEVEFLITCKSSKGYLYAETVLWKIDRKNCDY